ncbi:formimidoylglutamase [Pedobacter metabolipauper]|uniref:Formiminoglutamase n=1 Tax=Pedobacter metabolipauper TaxID=425513 RepID=A0A4R6SUZ6_9SPHI|nr:formimidoylglutamase [Pedobacter metabolipauper]TDQ09590.1 formiminoglutamase [Pedobacter metabolipauper]
MVSLDLYTSEYLLSLVKQREGETKLGECVQTISSLDHLTDATAAFVLVGISEDIGVRANYGTPGTSTAWEPALKTLLNVQSNRFLSGKELLVLGHIGCSNLPEPTIGSLQQEIEDLDHLVNGVIAKIAEAGKIPIVIGGGHNNAYPIIRGIAEARKNAIHTLNIDAHADLRVPLGRNSGNAFSYALRDGLLSKYGVFGLQQNYNNERMLELMDQMPEISAVFFDDLLTGSASILDTWTSFIAPFEFPGLEIDLDSVAGVLSSGGGPSGFTLNEIRKIILNSTKSFSYLHLCEGAVKLVDGREDVNTAKVIAYLITDFLKSQNNQGINPVFPL